MNISSIQPLVSIGMPIYNAEKYLNEALQALLAQDYTDFELIISDNGSQDRTEEICREFQKQDARVRYIRQPENLGAPANFEFVARQAKGEFFMWAAHDDLFHPSYIRKCLRELMAHPDAVLCCTEIEFIDVDGLPHPEWSSKGYKNFETLGMTSAQRIHELISRMHWFAIYGLIRKEALQKVTLGLSVYGADVIILEELMLLGEFAKVHEPLLSYRILKSKTAEDYQIDFNAAASTQSATKTPYTEMAAALLKTVFDSHLPAEQKTEVFADFVVTLTRYNMSWRNEITKEMLGEDVHLDDSAFAHLLATVLSRSVPLDTMKNNPLIRAMSHGPNAGSELLKVADDLLARPDGSFRPADSYKEAVRLFDVQRFEEASTFFADALKQEETCERWCDWATARLACNNANDGERGLRRALVIHPSNNLANLKLGVLLASLGRCAEALPYLEHYATRTNGPDHAEVMEMMGVCQSQLAVTQSS
jgi:glycosyltransferase involved in cell wall biosynthesis